jgi:hypothetical protein
MHGMADRDSEKIFFKSCGSLKAVKGSTLQKPATDLTFDVGHEAICPKPCRRLSKFTLHGFRLHQSFE